MHILLIEAVKSAHCIRIYDCSYIYSHICVFKYATDNIFMCVSVCVANIEHVIGKIPFLKAQGFDSIRYCWAPSFCISWKNGISPLIYSWLHHLWLRQYSKAQTHKASRARHSACLYSKAYLSCFPVKLKQEAGVIFFHKFISGYCFCKVLKFRVN